MSNPPFKDTKILMISKDPFGYFSTRHYMFGNFDYRSEIYIVFLKIIKEGT